MACLVKLSLSSLMYIYVILNEIKQASERIVLPHSSHSFNLASELSSSATVRRRRAAAVVAIFSGDKQGLVRLEKRNPTPQVA